MGGFDGYGAIAAGYLKLVMYAAAAAPIGAAAVDQFAYGRPVMNSLTSMDGAIVTTVGMIGGIYGAALAVPGGVPVWAASAYAGGMALPYLFTGRTAWLLPLGAGAAAVLMYNFLLRQTYSRNENAGVLHEINITEL